MFRGRAQARKTLSFSWRTFFTWEPSFFFFVLVSLCFFNHASGLDMPYFFSYGGLCPHVGQGTTSLSPSLALFPALSFPLFLPSLLCPSSVCLSFCMSPFVSVSIVVVVVVCLFSLFFLKFSSFFSKIHASQRGHTDTINLLRVTTHEVRRSDNLSIFFPLFWSVRLGFAFVI